MLVFKVWHLAVVMPERNSRFFEHSGVTQECHSCHPPSSPELALRLPGYPGRYDLLLEKEVGQIKSCWGLKNPDSSRSGGPRGSAGFPPSLE